MRRPIIIPAKIRTKGRTNGIQDRGGIVVVTQIAGIMEAVVDGVVMLGDGMGGGIQECLLFSVKQCMYPAMH